MALGTHISGHLDSLTALARQVGKLSKEVARLKTIVSNDTLKAKGYHLEVRPDADPPGLYIIKPNQDPDHRSTHGEHATFICP